MLKRGSVSQLVTVSCVPSVGQCNSPNLTFLNVQRLLFTLRFLISLPHFKLHQQKNLLFTKNCLGQFIPMIRFNTNNLKTIWRENNLMTYINFNLLHWYELSPVP